MNKPLKHTTINGSKLVKLKGSALIISITICTIATLFVGIAFMYFYYSNIRLLDYKRSKQVRANVNSGIAFYMRNPDLYDYDSTYKVILFDNETDSIFIRKSKWGICDYLLCSAYNRTQVYEKVLFTGALYPSDSGTALYSTDLNNSIYISGSTLLKGNIQIPNAGLLAVNFDGRVYESKELYQGTKTNSNSALPQTDKLVYQRIKQSIYDPIMPHEQILHYKDMPDTLINSFRNDVIHIISHDTIRLNGKFMKGKIKISSACGVKIGKTCYFEDIICNAPEIHIMSGATGSGQFFSTKKAILQQNSRLFYPSILINVSGADADQSKPHIVLSDFAQISGMLIHLEEHPDDKNQDILLYEESKVHGCVYTSGNLDLRGQVDGSVYCNRFIRKSTSRIYLNHLVDGKIDYSNWNKAVVLPELFDSKVVHKRMKWVY